MWWGKANECGKLEGCLSVPRKVQLDDENNLCMYPVDQIDSLISETITYRNIEVGVNRVKLYDDLNRSNRIIMRIEYQQD